MENQLSAIFALLPCVCVHCVCMYCVCVCIACRCRRHGEKIEATANLLISADTQKLRSHPANHRSHGAVQVPLEFHNLLPVSLKMGAPQKNMNWHAMPQPAAGNVFKVRRLSLFVWQELLRV